MREIKFRAWHKELKCMIIPDEMQGINISDRGWGIKMGDLHLVGDRWDETNSILMQYTGLKDKNNVEIYEGDIIKSRTNKTSNLVVEWMDRYARFILKAKSYEYKKTFHDTLRAARKSEVIGNIYEKPELLEDK